MSLSQLLLRNIDDVIQSYTTAVASRYNLNRDELIALWDSRQEGVPRATVVEPPSSERLVRAGKAELSALCKERGLKCTGTKDELISRLLGKTEGPNSRKKGTVETKTSEPEMKSAAKTTTKTDKKEKDSDIVKKLTANIPIIPIRRNVHGNFEHPDSRLIFDRKTETVIGKQQDDGTVSQLTDDDIEECKRYKFKYSVPANLDIGNPTETVEKTATENEEEEEEVELDDEDEEVEIEESEDE